MTTRRQREQRERRRSNAALWAEEQIGGPREWGIKHIKDITSTTTPEVNLYLRESDRKQEGNLIYQKRGSIQLIKEEGIYLPHRAFEEVCSGKSFERETRPELFRAIDSCEKEGLPLVIPCVTRLYRSPKCPWMPLAKGEVESCLELCRGVTVVSLFNPNADPNEDEVWLRELYSRVSGKIPNRPRVRYSGYKKELKREFIALARELRKQKLSLRAIAVRISLESGFSITEGGLRGWFSSTLE